MWDIKIVFFGCIVWYSRKPNKLFYFVVIIVALCCGVFSFSEYVKTFVKYLRFFARLLHTSSYRLHIVLLADRCTSFAYMNRKWNRLNTYSMWKSRKCCNGENICKNKEKKRFISDACMQHSCIKPRRPAKIVGKLFCLRCWMFELKNTYYMEKIFILPHCAWLFNWVMQLFVKDTTKPNRKIDLAKKIFNSSTIEWNTLNKWMTFIFMYGL